jgi:hypothetical protein
MAVPAVAFPPNARTDSPTEVTETGATLNGLAYEQASGPCPCPAPTYHFEYGATKAYGKQTPEAQAPQFTQSSGEPKVSQRVSLPGGSTFHFRVVATNSGGEKGFGDDIEWRTPGPPPPGPGTTRTTDTVGPGGSVTTGSDPSKSNPIVVKVTSEKGGKIHIDETKNPERPGADPDAEENPEDDGPKDKHWYGPAFTIYPPGLVTVVFTIDGDTDLVDPTEGRKLLEFGQNPAGVTSCSIANRRVLANGDTRLTLTCRGGTFNFYNPGWGVRGGEYFGSFNSSLDTVRKQGYLDMGFWCVLKCKRTITASIAPKSARKLNLKSSTLATVHTEFGKAFNQRIPLSAKVRRALGRPKQITIVLRAKAVGPDGQVLKKTGKVLLKADPDESDSF